MGKIEQSQITDGESFSAQAGRDLSQTIHVYNGVSERDVKEICLDLYHKNNAQLSVIAQDRARIEVEKYAEILFTSLSDGIKEEIEEKLKEPEIQAAINDTVKIVARKGSKVDKEYLGELIKEKIEHFDDEQKSSIIDDAIEAMEKISLSQLVFFAFIHAIRTLSVVWNGKSYKDYEDLDFPVQNFGNFPENINDILPREERKKIISKLMKDLYISNFEVGQVMRNLKVEAASHIDLELLQLRGLAYDDKTYTVKIIDHIQKNWGPDDSVEKNINETLSKVTEVLNKFGLKNIEQLDTIVLTPIAKYIGDTYLRSQVKIIS